MTNLPKLSSGVSPPKRGRPKSATKSSSKQSADSFYRNLLHVRDEKLAEEYAHKAAENRADAAFPELPSVAAEHAEMDAKYKKSLKKLTALEDRKYATPERMKSNQMGTDNQGIPFNAWRRFDQVSMGMLSLALPCALVTGASNAYVALVSSGSAIFIEQPWIAVLISLLVPTGGIALKFLSNFFHYEFSKKRFAILVYAVTSLLLFSWSIVFASEFSAASGGIDWNNLGESNGKSNLLNWLQLTSELMLATCLSLAMESIYNKYRKDGEMDNPEYHQVCEALMLQQKSHDALKKDKAIIDQQYQTLRGLHSEMMLQEIVAFKALLARFNEAQNF